MLRLDHLAISCARLEDGVAAVETLCGVPMVMVARPASWLFAGELLVLLAV